MRSFFQSIKFLLGAAAKPPHRREEQRSSRNGNIEPHWRRFRYIGKGESDFRSRWFRATNGLVHDSL